MADDLESLAKEIQRELTAAKAKLAELQRALAALPAQQQVLPFVCERCPGGQSFKSQARLEEHLANVHAIGLEEVAPPQLLLEGSESAQRLEEDAEPASTIGEHLAEARAVEQHQEEKHGDLLDRLLPLEPD